MSVGGGRGLDTDKQAIVEQRSRWGKAKYERSFLPEREEKPEEQEGALRKEDVGGCRLHGGLLFWNPDGAPDTHNNHFSSVSGVRVSL